MAPAPRDGEPAPPEKGKTSPASWRPGKGFTLWRSLKAPAFCGDKEAGPNNHKNWCSIKVLPSSAAESLGQTAGIFVAIALSDKAVLTC